MILTVQKLEAAWEYWVSNIYYYTKPMNNLELDDPISQLKLEHWLCGTFVFNFCHFRRGGTVLVGNLEATILLAFWKRMHHFIGKFKDKTHLIGYWKEKAPFYVLILC